MDQERQQSGPPSVPSVDPVHLRKVWNFLRDRQAFGNERALGRELAERELGPVGEWVRYRAGMLYILILRPDDLLAPWRRGFLLDDVVFRVAAVFPMEWIGEGIKQGLPFDVDAFLRQIRNPTPLVQ